MSTLLQAQWFFPLFVIAMVSIGALLAVVSGWRTLAKRFPAKTQVDGERYYFASAKMGLVSWFPVNYGACLTITVGRNGLAMSIFVPFGFLCPALFIPWAEVESVEERSTALSRRTLVRIRGSSVWLALRGTVGQRAAAMFSSLRSEDAR